MATVKIIKVTNNLAVAKVSGTGSGTVTLATDLLPANQVISGTPKVSIGYAQWNISPGASDTITVTRNSVGVLHLFQNAGELDMSGNGGYLDNTEEASDIVVNIVGTGDLYLTLRKTEGYVTKIEPEFYGQYDNPAAVGS
jgi:hypothetical protein